MPRLEQVPSPLGYLVVPPALSDYQRAPEAVLRLRVAAWLDQPSAQATRGHALDSDDLAQIRALATAALRDVAALPVEAVHEWVRLPPIKYEADEEEKHEIARKHSERRRAIMAGGSPPEHQGDLRATKRQIARGRDLWWRLAAWPWWAIVAAGEDVSGGLPRRWWDLGAVQDALAAWHDADSPVGSP